MRRIDMAGDYAAKCRSLGIDADAATVARFDQLGARLNDACSALQAYSDSLAEPPLEPLAERKRRRWLGLR